MRRAGLAVLVALAVWLAHPQTADAHLHSGSVAEDYRASAAPLRGLASALSVRIYKTDRALGLTVRPGHTVTVIGYLREPFIRLSSAGVLVNAASPTSAATGLLKRPQREATKAPTWVVHSRGRTIVFHTASLRGLPPDVTRSSWRVPLVVDGHRAALTGEIWRVPRPLLWPWLALGVPFALAVALVFVRRGRSRIRGATMLLGGLSAAATIAVAAAFALSASANGGHLIEGANELVFVLAGIGLLTFGSPNARAFAGGGFGLLALAVGLSTIPALLHGVVLSAFPATPTRLAISVAIWAGAAATILGLVVFFEVLEEGEPLPGSRLDRARETARGVERPRSS
jgi:hypothetical protein